MEREEEEEEEEEEGKGDGAGNMLSQFNLNQCTSQGLLREGVAESAPNSVCLE